MIKNGKKGNKMKDAGRKRVMSPIGNHEAIQNQLTNNGAS